MYLSRHADFRSDFKSLAYGFITRIFQYHILSRVFIAAHSQKISVNDIGGRYFGRQIRAGTASSPDIVRLPSRRVGTVRALAHVIARGSAHKDSAESALHHSF
jgi:hypothetical protein